MTNDKGLGAAVSLDDWEDARPMLLDPARTRAPLSPMQRRLWLVDQVIVGTALHNVPWAWVLSPGADPARVQEAIEAIVLRHVALRTQFTLDADGEPVQWLVDHPVELTSIDVVPATSHAMRERAEAFAREPIAWDAPRPWRVALLRAGEAGCWLVFSAHHLIVDGWSIDLLRQAFDDAMAGVMPGDDPATASPFDLACWTADAGDDTGASLDWWQERLRDVSAVDLSRTRAPRAAVASGDVLHFDLPRGTTAAMDAYCRAERCTPFMVLLAAYAVVLYRYTGTSIMAVGTPVTRRDQPELLGTVGCFVDTVVRRVAVDANVAFADVVRGIRDDLLLSYAHEHVPLEEIVQRMQPVRDATRSPLFQVMLSVSHAGAGGGSAHVIETIPLPTGTAKVDLSLTVLMPADATHEPAAVLEFAKDLLDARQVEGFSRHFSRVLADAVVAPDTRIGAISMLPDDELVRLHQLSATGESAPPCATIVDRFREAAARDGSAIAVRRGDDTLDYATLDLASTAFASRLIDAGVTRGSRVCVLAAREVETIVAVLGVLKAAAVYVPMDPALPMRRLEAIVASARPSALASAHAPAFATDHVPILWPRPGDDAQVPVSASAPGTRDLAYMIHTSGSTGVPKGVVVTHEGLARYLTSVDALYRRREGRVLLHSPFGFDLSITNLFLPLARGDTIELLGEDASLDDLADALRTGAYDVVKMTPSHLEALQPLLDRPGTSLRLGSLVIGGEALGEATLRWWRAAAAGVEILNEYGPTEAVVGCCVYDASAAGEATDVPIGAALPGVRLYVLDSAGERAPYGVPGELYIGGDGLALGYHARPGATACAFLPDPFAGVPGARMYRTGDRVRYLDDGALVFLGRVDRQLKIRGYRIEPGEVEAVLRGHPEVRLAVVFPRERSTGTQLVACVAADPRRGLVEALHDWLACRLPAFQIPSLIVALPELPLTTNGKIDRARLPDRSADESASPPAGATEVRLHGIWRELLGGAAIDRHADFFSLGGHSLLATRMVAQVRSEFAVDVEVRAFFEAPSIAGFARRIDTAAAITVAGLSAWPRADVDAYGEVAASLAQGRIFLVDRMAPGDVSYNVPVAVGLRGDVQVDALQAALDGLLARHDVLRSGLRERAADIRSFVVEAANVPIITESCPVSAMTERARTFSSMPFDLGAPPLIRALLLDHGDRHATLVLCFHHAVIDGWSMPIVWRDLGKLHDAWLRGTRLVLPAPAIRYADYASWQRAHPQRALVSMERWLERLAGVEPLALPYDAVPGTSLETLVQPRVLALPPGLVTRVRDFARACGTTPFTVLLATFKVLMARYADTDDVAVLVPVANRSMPQTQDLVGFFVNTVILRTKLGGTPGFTDAVRRVQATCRDAIADEDLPFDALVERLGTARAGNGPAAFPAMFAFHDTRTGGPSFAGLLAEPVELHNGSTKHPLTFNLTDAGSDMVLQVEYAAAYFHAATIQRMAARFVALLDAALDAPSECVWDLDFDAQESEEAVGPHDYDVIQAIDAIARERGSAVALRSTAGTLTYRDLADRTWRLATYLRASGATPGQAVGLCIPRSNDMIVALLAILRTGAHYVPIDPELPAERLARIVGDADVSLVVTQWSSRPALAPSVEVVLLDLDKDAIAACEPMDVRVDVADDELAYIIPTSGSTGVPKGVMITRGGLAAYARWAADAYGAADSVLHTPLSFDLTLTSIVVPLLGGATIILLDQDADLDGLAAALRAAPRPVLLKATPAHLGGLALLPDPATARHGVGTLVVGGEMLHNDVVRAWRDDAPATRIANEYGPTETVVGCSVHWVTGEESTASVPIGHPAAGALLYVLDSRGRRSAKGTIGELHIGGPAVARGYARRPDLTAERFLPDPFAVRPGQRMYRTGDRVRVGDDGSLEYLGRTDRQLKIRGYRIEPAEIEAALLSHASVAEVLVMAGGDEGARSLIAFVVPAPGVREVAVLPLVEHLRERLPRYALPSRICPVDAMPLTANGKVDQASLLARMQREERPSAATTSTPTQSLLAGIWTEVLGEDRAFGIHDDFFDLGGHSLLATRVVSRVRQAFGVELSLRSVFEEPTVAGMARRVDEALRGSDRAEAGVVPVPRTGLLPVSYAQQRLWFLAGLEPDSIAYHVPLGWSLDGTIDESALGHALDDLVARHEVLRTRVVVVGDEPMQIVDAVMSLPLRRVEVADADAADAWMREAIRKRFDLSSGPLIRAWLVSLPDATHRLLLSMHHIVVDNWAVGVLLDELAVLYRSHRAGTEPALPALAVQYADYASWQRRWMDSAASARQLSYWRTQLSGLEPLSLPTDRPRPAVQGSRGAMWTFRVPAELSRGLSRLSRREGATLFMTLLAGFQVVLGRYAGTRDVAIGSPVANRNRAEVEGLIGFFVNTVVLRTDLGGSPGFAELVRRARQVCLDAYAHQELPFEKLVEELQPERDLSRTPLFQVLFALQNAHTSDVSLEGVSCTALELGTDTSKFDLNLSMQEHGEGIEAAIEYNPDLFDAMTVERLSGHYLTVLAAAVDEPERDIDSLPLMDAAERSWLSAWNRSDVAVAEEGLLAKLSRWSRERPTSMAVREGERTLDFAGLDRATAQVARALVARGVGVEDRVGLWLERSVEQLVALLGVLRAGAAYVPLDPSLPSRRLEAMARTAAVTLVIGGDTPLAALPWLPVAQACAHAGDEALPEAMAPASLAYVMFTSGSTGEPKGTMVTRGGLDNYLDFAGERYLSSWQGGEGSVVHSSLGFDLTVTSLLAPLAAGHGVRLLAGGAQVDGLVDALREEGASLGLLKLTPAHLEVLEQALGEAGPRARVGTLVIGGEALHESRLRYWRRHAPQTRLINEYGPTETVVGCSVYEASEAGAENAAVPIGRPLANLRLHVLDAWMQAVPAGVPGEVYIGGAGVARGYTGRADLTAERFVPDPFAGHPGERLYRTGDRARRRADGELEYLGRLDEQLKLRGYRLEPGEVEAALVALPGIAQAAVGVHRRADGLGNLVAWYVGVDGVESSADALREALRGWLPEHAIPVHYRRLDALPLTVNGKLDRQALPAPSDDELARPLVAPRTAVESRLSDIWAQAEVLGVDQLGIHDDFFDLGGHSLLATRVVSRVRQAFDVELPLRSIFEEPTIAGMARRVEEALGGGDRAKRGSIISVDRTRPLPLSYAQQRLWFLHRMDPESGAYSVPLGMELVGPLDVEAMDAAIVALGRRHEVLRTRFEEIDGTPFQRIEDAAMPALVFVDLSSHPDPDAAVTLAARESMATRFDLRQGPLLRAHLYRLAEERHQLVFTMHHIVLDGWSVGILLRELDALYRAAVTGRAADLPPLAVQYADFAAWQRDESHGPALDAQRMYWRAQLAGLSTLELPTSRPRPVLRSGRGVAEPFSVPNDVVAGVRRLGRREGATLFMGMLAGFVATLHRYSGADEVAVGSPVAGRDRAEIEGLIGFFVNTLVLRTDLRGKPDARELLARVRKVCVDAFANQEVPFERLVEDIQPERDLGRSPLFQVMFSLNDVNGSNDTFAAFDTRYLPLHNDTAKFDLNMHLDEKAGSVGGILEYDSDLFDAAWIRAFIGHFHAILRAMVEEPEIAIAHMPMLSVEERAHLASVNARHEVVAPRSALDAFEASAEIQPAGIAVVAGDASVAYAALDERAARLAGHLVNEGVKAGDIVGMHLERGIDFIVALLAVWKAGAGFVALDPAWPASRLAYIAADTGLSHVISHWRTRQPLGARVTCEVFLDLDEAAIAATAPHAGTPVPPSALAYVMYTSGSTGQPKGVMVPHVALGNYLAAAAEYTQGTAAGWTVAHSPTGFDLGLTSMLLPLSQGGCVVLAAPGDELDTLVAAILARRPRGFLKVTPSHLPVLVERLAGHDLEGALDCLVIGGEALTESSLEPVRQLLRGVRIVNEYGPTEATVGCVVADVSASSGTGPAPIGGPIAQTTLYVLDAHMERVPFGVPGDIHLGGMSLAHGYLGRPDLTAERFVPDPYSPIPGARLYRTGDLGVYAPDGMLRYLGRRDEQLKVRGYRIEPEQVVAAIRGLPSVRHAAVYAGIDTAGVARLCAAVVPRDGAGFDLESLKRHLADLLPAHEVPQGFSIVESFPLTDNGKLDRAALRRAVEAPVTPERAQRIADDTVLNLLAGIWSDVLGSEVSDPLAGFFDLGGHSLLATRVAARIRQVFGVELALRAIFTRPTLAGMADAVREAMRATTGSVLRPLRPVDHGTVSPALSFAQARLWFLQQMAPESVQYNMPFALELQGDIDVQALEEALTSLTERHASLRTVFGTVDDEPVQCVLPMTRLVIDTRHVESDDELTTLVERAARRPFDLAHGPLLRAALYLRPGNRQVLLLSMHHIVADGWSVGVLMRDLGHFYAIATGRPSVALPALPVTYADYASWHAAWLGDAAYDVQARYWTRQLDGLRPLDMPLDRPRKAMQGTEGGVISFAIPADLAVRVRRLAREGGATLFMTLLAAFDIVLSRHARTEDVAVGTFVANRSLPEVQDVVGLFVNTLVLRVDASGSPTFRQLLERVREVSLDAYSHQDMPFEKLVEVLAPERDLSVSPMFGVLFQVQDETLGAGTLGDLTYTPYPVAVATSKFDLHVAIAADGDGLAGAIEYALDLFDAPTVERLGAHLVRVLKCVVDAPDAAIDAIALADASDETWLDARNTSTTLLAAEDGIRGRDLATRFEQRVRRQPTTVALRHGKLAIDFATLNARANRIAHHLRAQGVGPEGRVAICMERSFDLVTTLLAVLKTGAAYVPIDAEYPPARIALMLEVSGASLLVTHRQHERALAGTVPLLLLDADTVAIAARSAENLGVQVYPAQAAYVVFTSGSTGTPKGVVGLHGATLNRLDWMYREWPFQPGEVCCAKTSLGFVDSVWELLGPLLAGVPNVLVPSQQNYDAIGFMQTLQAEKVSRIVLVPSLLRTMLDVLPAGSRALDTLRICVTSGEAMAPDLAAQALERLPGCRLLNLYGASENGADVTWHDVSPDDATGAIPLGTPIDRTHVYVLDESLRRVPPGMIGEVHVASAGLARGYEGRPDLTAERFVPNPFSPEPGGRMYRTGDLGRYRPDGSLMFAGRTDQQVKLRGRRIELGEIENALLALQGVRAAAVRLHRATGDDVGGRIVAYVVADEVVVEGLREALAASLPAYMLPSAWQLLDALPLTPSGKLDRRALAPPAERLASSVPGGSPRSDTEVRIAAIWARLLRIDSVGLDESFFDAGGHSLQLVKLRAEMQREFNVEISVVELFARPTVRALARLLGEGDGDVFHPSAIQRRAALRGSFYSQVNEEIGKGPSNEQA